MSNTARTHARTGRNDLPVGVLCPCRLASPQPPIQKNLLTKKCQDMISSRVVTKLDGTAPTPAAISKAASEFGSEKKKRGRKLGQNKTTKAEDRAILKTFHKLRPPGKGCPSSHALLPQATMHNSLVNVFQGRACLSFACSWSLACSLRNSLSFLVGSVM